MEDKRLIGDFMTIETIITLSRDDVIDIICKHQNISPDCGGMFVDSIYISSRS